MNTPCQDPPSRSLSRGTQDPQAGAAVPGLAEARCQKQPWVAFGPGVGPPPSDTVDSTESSRPCQPPPLIHNPNLETLAL
jgi:hypothetical protein